MKKKLLTLSDIAEELLSDKSAETGISQNQLIDDAIIKTYVSSDERVLAYVRSLYRDDGYKRSVTLVLSDLCSFYSSGETYHAAYANGRILIDVISSVIDWTPQFSSSSEDQAYIDSSLNCFKRKLNDSPYLELIDGMIGKPISQHNLQNLIMIIKDNWSLFGDWNITYKFLCYLLRDENTHVDTAKDRLELIKAIKELSKEWI